ncbi:MAG: alkaline phosphatase PhoX [Halothiobacillaceae bacterium]
MSQTRASMRLASDNTQEYITMLNPLLARFPLAALGAAVGLALTGCGGGGEARVASVEFTSTPAATTEEQMLKTYTTSIARVTYTNGSVQDYPLTYNTLFKNTDPTSEVKGKKYAAAQLFDVGMNPIKDLNGDPVIAETADASSLLKVGDKLFLVNHWEYDDVLADGREAWKVPGWYSRMPMSMNLSELRQDANGKLSLVKQTTVDFSPVNGGWIFCAGGPSPWNTHLGGEEDYDLYFVPGEKKYTTTQAGLKAMTEVYFNNMKTANPYHYGFITEVVPKADGTYTVQKLYNMGRGTWELARFANDGRTAVLGDDGEYAGIFMFVGDKPNDPKAGGSLYAAKWNQTSPDGSDGGTANIQWVKLGSATHDEIKRLIDSGITISDIFEISLTERAGFVPTRAGSSETIWIKLKPGMEKAAAFLETRRYAAYLGATTEFTKGEGVAINHADKKMYFAMSRIEKSMKALDGGPVDHVRLKENKAGATYTFDLASGQKDTQGNPINSDWVPVKAYVEPALLGKPIAADANGNTADVNSIANTDNLFYSETMRTLFIGEDSGMHVNNYLWAYNVDTKKLSRILNVAAGAESTGLQVVDDLNGHAYIMANNQHQGDWISTQPAALTARLEAKADQLWGRNHRGTLNYRLEAHVGYIGGMPAIRK